MLRVEGLIFSVSSFAMVFHQKTCPSYESSECMSMNRQREQQHEISSEEKL